MFHIVLSENKNIFSLDDLLQAVRWLSDLFGVLVDKHVEIGCDATEIQTQKDEHLSFQDTAKV